MEIAFAPGQVLRFDKSLTGTDLDSDQEQTSLLKRLEWAVSRIDVNKLKNLMPAVGMNMLAVWIVRGRLQRLLLSRENYGCRREN